MHSRIGYICSIFPHGAFSNVSSKKMKSCIGCTCSTFLHCVFSVVVNIFFWFFFFQIFNSISDIPWNEQPALNNTLEMHHITGIMSLVHIVVDDVRNFGPGSWEETHRGWSSSCWSWGRQWWRRWWTIPAPIVLFAFHTATFTIKLAESGPGAGLPPHKLD